MIVDLFTDASIVKGRGVWAVVIVRDGVLVAEHAGPLRGSFRSSAATEICAIANGLHHARKVELIRQTDQVRVWCDNMAAVMWANGLCRAKQKTDSRLIEGRRFIRDFHKRERFGVRAYHIKGHQRLETDDAQAIYNIRADELCSAIRDGKEAQPFDALVNRIRLAHERRAKREAKAA